MKHIILILAVFSLMSCKSHKKTNKDNNEVIISLAKKSGRGKSPAYSLKIYANGDVIFKGEKNIDKIGTYKTKLTQEELAVLVEKFRKAHFFEFKNEYTSKILDLPTTYIEFADGDKRKKIRDYYGAPPELKDLEKEVEKLVYEKQWKKIE